MSPHPRHLTILATCLIAVSMTTHASPAVCKTASRAQSDTESEPHAIDALARWVEQNCTPAKIRQLTEDGKHSVRDALQQTLIEAHTRRAQRTGLFFFDPDDATDPLPLWARPAPGHQARCTTAVLLVHGLDEPGDIWDELAPELHDAGFCVARFEYPNDQAIADSTHMLAGALTTLAEAGVTDVNIVAHSMGGLIARDLLTAPDYYDTITADHPELPNIPHLITIGTPNLGSAFAPLRTIAELRDQFHQLPSLKDISAADLLAFVADGDGTAGIDLKPNSPYLTELNARPLPQGTHFTIIAGRIAPAVSDGLADILDSSFARALLTDEQIAALTTQAAAANDAIGDGVVSLDSATSLQIPDTEVLDADHRSMLRTVPLERTIRRWTTGETRTEPPAIPIILDRLAPHPLPSDQPASN